MAMVPFPAEVAALRPARARAFTAVAGNLQVCSPGRIGASAAKAAATFAVTIYVGDATDR
ncbi:MULTISPECIES: hypothetical protein [Methylosinus]|uniref:hypothetical protein n=1 Tax=Methylosinus TaxID=425 RepID=UPI0012DBF7B6|nr:MULTISPECIES: hypothetical protein [Methylosinus]